MADETRKIIRVSPESDKAIRTYAERRGLEFGDAADALIATAVSRLNALKKYSKSKHEGAPKGKPRSKKGATSKKAAKAAPPPARKAKAAHANGAAAHA